MVRHYKFQAYAMCDMQHLADINLLSLRELHYITLHYIIIISYAIYTWSDQWCFNKVMYMPV